jgi:glucose-1-phosphate adenylyltransferase
MSIAVTPVPRAQASEFGIMQVDANGRIIRFVEKPQDDALLDELTPNREALGPVGIDMPEGWLLASTGIYLFKSGVLNEMLRDTSGTDFGKDVIPAAIHSHGVYAYLHRGYWRDIGTIEAFHKANLALTLPLPPLNLYSLVRPIYTHPRFLPGTKINRCAVEQSILCEGSIISESRIRRSIIGIRAVVRKGATIDASIVMGARSYEQQEDEDAPAQTVPKGVGPGCTIRNAIVDLDARIGEGVQLVNEAGVQEADEENWCIREGIIVVPTGATIPPGTVV